MNKKLLAVAFIGIVGSGAFAMLPVYAQAATTQVQRVSRIIARSDTEIGARVTSLNNLNTRVQALKNVSDSVKSNLAAEIQTNITGLTSLKAKIDGETDIPTLQSDEKSIFTAYRVYALVIPQGYLVAASDRVNTIDALMATASSKLQVRISQDQSAGDNTIVLQSALSDLNSKIADAESQAQAAKNGISSLVPDEGNQAMATSNHTALVTARGEIKTATTDFQAARKDISTIQQGLRGFERNASATTQ